MKGEKGKKLQNGHLLCQELGRTTASSTAILLYAFDEIMEIITAIRTKKKKKKKSF